MKKYLTAVVLSPLLTASLGVSAHEMLQPPPPTAKTIANDLVVSTTGSFVCGAQPQKQWGLTPVQLEKAMTVTVVNNHNGKLDLGVQVDLQGCKEIYQMIYQWEAQGWVLNNSASHAHQRWVIGGEKTALSAAQAKQVHGILLKRLNLLEVEATTTTSVAQAQPVHVIRLKRLNLPEIEATATTLRVQSITGGAQLVLDRPLSAYPFDPTLQNLLIAGGLQFKTSSPQKPGQWLATDITQSDMKSARANLVSTSLNSAVDLFSGRAAGKSEESTWQVEFEFTAMGAKKLETLTTKSIGQALGIFASGKLISAPRIASPITEGSALIDGLDRETALLLANSAKWPILPSSLKVSQHQIIP